MGERRERRSRERGVSREREGGVSRGAVSRERGGEQREKGEQREGERGGRRETAAVFSTPWCLFCLVLFPLLQYKGTEPEPWRGCQASARPRGCSLQFFDFALYFEVSLSCPG